jgi:hypothetical protein
LLDLVSFRKDVEEFSSETGLEYYLNWSGQKDELNISKIYDKYSHLFRIENVDDLRVLRGRERRGTEFERRLRYLQAFVTAELLQQNVKGYTDEAETVDATEKIRIDGENIPYRLAEVRYTNEENREKRAKIFDARNKVIEQRINPILEKRMEKLHNTAIELGYDNYVELFRDTNKIDFEELSKKMNYFDNKTDSLYTDAMGEFVQKTVGVELDKAEKHDVAFLFRAKEFDPYFTKERTLTVLKSTLNGIGFDYTTNKNVSVDLEERPKKSPRAFTAIIRVPDKVILVVMPKGGQDDYDSILHEAGHTAHYASVDPRLSMEYRWLGDISVTETYAFLLEYLTLNTIWLNENIGLKNLKKYLDFSFLHKLFYLRRYSAKLRYELLLHRSKRVNEMSGQYKEQLENLLGFNHPESHYLSDVDDGFYSAEYLRAWIFEAQLRNNLVEKFGDKWFKNPETGKFLAELWSLGQKYNVVELAQRIGLRGLDVNPILTEITDHFS